MKNILLLTRSISEGGAERAIAKLSLYLKDYFNVHIAVYNSYRVDYEFGGTLHSIDNRSWLLTFKFFRFMHRFFVIAKIKQELNIDCSISFLTGPNLLNVLTNKNNKTIISIRNNEFYKYSILASLLSKFIAKRADKIICVSTGIYDNYISKYHIKPQQIDVINNAFDTNSISRLSLEKIDAEYEVYFKKPVLITVGRLVHQKNHISLLKIFSELISSGIECNLLIIGDGPLKAKLEHYVLKNKLNKNVFFIKYQKNPFKFIYRSSIYISTSLYEGFPNVLVEAMISKTVVISTDCDTGPSEILNKNYSGITNKPQFTSSGVLMPKMIEKYEFIDWVDTIKKLLHENELSQTIISNAYNYVKKYDYSNVNYKWLKIIEEIIQ